MKQKIEVLKSTEVLGKELNVYGSIEEPLFLAKDVATWIGHTNPASMLQSIDEDEKLIETMFISGQGREVWFLTEYGLYEVLMQSRKKIAKQFKKEVKKILKEIRQNGGYLVATEEDDENTIVERALNLAQKAIQRLKEQNTQLTERNDYLSKIFQSKDLYTATDIAQKYGMSTIKFNKLLNDLGIQYKRNGQWLLYADKANLGLADVKTYVIGTEDNPRLSKSLQWTAKGLEYIFNLLNEKDIHLTSQAS